MVLGPQQNESLASFEQSKVAGYFVVVPPGSVYRTDIIAEFFRDVGRHWLFATILGASGIAVALALSFVVQRTYRAEVTLIATDSDQSDGFSRITGGLSGIASLAGFDVQSRTITQEALAVLNSADFSAEFVRAHDILPLLFPGQQISSGREDTDSPTEQDGIEEFNKRIRRVVVDEDAGVVRIRIYWSDPSLAAMWANDIVRRLNERMRANAIADSERSLEFLRRELNETLSIEIRQGLSDLIRTQMGRRMLVSVREQYAFRIIDPAIAPDTDKYVYPSHLLFGILGCMAGLSLALMIIGIRRGRH